MYRIDTHLMQYLYKEVILKLTKHSSIVTMVLLNSAQLLNRQQRKGKNPRKHDTVLMICDTKTAFLDVSSNYVIIIQI